MLKRTSPEGLERTVLWSALKSLAHPLLVTVWSQGFFYPPGCNRLEVAVNKNLASHYVQGLNLKMSGHATYLVNQHPNPRQGQILILVLEGRVTLLIEGQPLKAQTGETVTVPTTALHALQNNASTPSRVLLLALSKLEQTHPFVISPLVAADLAGAYD
jgi:mannose-6-phosphate isomerase-like protein (cupin superfamily)